MKHYSKIIIRVGPGGQETAEYIASVTEELIREDWNSTQSILKKYMPEDKSTDEFFTEKAAGYLGRVAAENHCDVLKWVKVETVFETLNDKPENLGEPILDSSIPKGVALWLLNTDVHSLPSV